MAFRVIAPAAEGKPKFRVIKPAQEKRSVGETAFGLGSVFNRSIPFMDEAGAGLAAAADSVGDVMTGRKRSLAENFKARMAKSREAAKDFERENPTAANLTKGAGLAVQMLPAFMTGGATATPTIASTVPRGLMGATARALKPAADAAVVSGLSAQLAAYGGDGTLAERAETARRTTVPAMAIGAALPVTIAAASKGRRLATDAGRATGRTVSRLANRASGGKVLDPNQEALKRLGEALKADGLGPQDVRAALAEWQRSGASSPALMDLAGENTRALLRAAAAAPTRAGQTGAARNTAVRYANRVTADLQDNAIARARALTADARALPQIADDVTGRINAASVVDDVPAGSGGQAVSRALNARFDAAKQGVDSAYDAARAAAPEAAHLRTAEFPQLRANVREAIRDFHPDDISSVAREMEGLDLLSTPTIRDLYETRQRLTGVRLSKPDQAVAAARAIRALDDEIAGAVERGAVTGDDEVVGLWRNAIAARRDMGRQFEGGDLIQRLTEREFRGGGRANAVAPEDASSVILGRNGINARPDLTRDLTRLRDTLGADSPEWQAFQRESVSRILGRDAGSENFGDAWQAFQRQNPQLAELLMGQSERSALTGARQQIADAVADRGAVEAGRSVMRASPDQLAADVGALGDRRGLAQVGAAREIEDMIGRPPEGGTGLLNRLSSGTNPSRNLSAIFGDDEAARFQDAIGRELDRVANARFIDPNANSKTANVLLDQLAEFPSMSKAAIAKALFDKLRRGVSLTEGERAALMEIGTSLVRSAADVPAIPTTPQAMRLLSPRQRARLAAVLGAGQGQLLAQGDAAAR